MLLNPALISIMSRYRTPAKGETKSSHNDSAHSVAHSSLGLSAVDCAAPTEAWGGVGLLVTRGGLER